MEQVEKLHCFQVRKTVETNEMYCHYLELYLLEWGSSLSLGREKPTGLDSTASITKTLQTRREKYPTNPLWILQTTAAI